MAIIQISQIKHRRGLRSDLPFSLEEGELGLTLDTGELFIGTPNLPNAIERAKSSAQQYFPFKNTQILTEWTDNVKNTLNYRYRYRKVLFSELSSKYQYGNDFATPSITYINSSGVSSFFVISRKLQERLDETVSVKSYGALGNGFKDFSSLPSQTEMQIETNAIRKAALDVSNVTNVQNSYGEWKPRSLFFPAGVYCINDSLILPPNSYWYGEGKDNTIIVLCSSNNITITKGFNDCLMFTVDGDLKPEDSVSALPNHSYQNLNSPVENIYVRDITFVIKRDSNKTGKNKPFDIIRLIGASNVVFENCQFIGNWSNVVVGSASQDYEVKATSNGIFYYPGNNFDHGDSIGVVIDSRNQVSPQYKSKNIHFINCDFKNTTYGSIITDDVDNVRFIGCTFNRHYRAVSISEPVVSGLTVGLKGPVNIFVEDCIIRNVKAEGIYVGKLSTSANNSYDSLFNRERFSKINFGSFFNVFENVGNNNTNNGFEEYPISLSVNPVFPVISFSSGATYCYSIGDSFSRSYVLEKIGGCYGKTVERVKFNNKNNNIVINSRDFYVEPVRELVLSANTSGRTGLCFDVSSSNCIFINYSIGFSNSSIKRIGNIRIVSNGTTPIIDDDYVETSNSNLVFDVSLSGQEIKLIYDNYSSGNAIFSYNFKYWNI